MYSVSVVIVTYKRQKELEECILSVLNQVILPKEIIVIDNGQSKEVKKLCDKIKLKFSKNTPIIYLESKENSLTVSKNTGIKMATGELISFIDDDSTINKNYYKKAIDIFQKHPHIQGIMGINDVKRKNKFLNKLTNIYNKLFFISAETNDYCKLWPSLGNTYPRKPSKKLIPCMWSSGQSIYKKEVLLEIKPDNNLKKYCWNEDIDLSHRIYKKYPRSLFLSKEIHYFHVGSENARLPKKEQIYMAEVYDAYLFNIHFDNNILNVGLYIWSRIGRNLKNTLIYLYNLNFKNILYIFGAQIYVLSNLKKIRNKDISFFNKTLR